MRPRITSSPGLRAKQSCRDHWGNVAKSRAPGGSKSSLQEILVFWSGAEGGREDGAHHLNKTERVYRCFLEE